MNEHQTVPMGQWFMAYLGHSINHPAKTKVEGDLRVQLTFMAHEVDKLWLENQELRARIAELEARP